MEFALSEEQAELVATVRSLMARHADPAAVRAAIASEPGYDEALWRRLVEQIGAAALAVPEEHGGAGFSLFEALLVLEEVGRTLAPSPLLASLVVAEALKAGGDADACARLLPRVAAGEVAALVDGPGPALDAADATVLLAVVDDRLVEVDPATCRRTAVTSMDQTLRLARVDLDGAALTPVGDGRAARERARLVGAVAVGALQVGLGSRALDMTVGYSKQRVQFGRPIGSFQALKHRMAEMLVLVEMSRSAAWQAGYAVAHDLPDAAQLTHVVGSYVGDALATVAAETVQLHGGIAITWEHDAQLVFKRAHALGQLFGTPREHRSALELTPA